MTKKTIFLLAATVAILTMGAGCATQNVTNTTDNTPSSTAVAASTTESMASFSIKELGITFDIPEKYKNEITYQISTSGSSAVALMSWNNHISKSVMGQDSNCGPGELGKISKNTNPVSSETGEARDPITGVDIKVGNDYVTIEGPQDLCTGDKNLQKTMGDMIKALENAVPTVRALVVSSADSTANWKTYTNPTFGYSINYPATWTEKQRNVLEAGASEDEKNVTVQFYNNDKLTLLIGTDYKTKAGDPSLLSLVSEVSPKGSFGISDVVPYKIGGLDGYRRLVDLHDPPAAQVLEYFTKDSKYIYHLVAYDKTESPEVVNMLKTFTTQKSLREYFATREQFRNKEMPKDSNKMDKTPAVLGFKELAKIEVTCPDSLGTPCGGTLLVLSKDPIHSGNQEFYFAFTMGTGYMYYGPFTDDLQRIINESKAIKSLERTN